jgi:hypothetical protein
MKASVCSYWHTVHLQLQTQLGIRCSTVQIKLQATNFDMKYFSCDQMHSVVYWVIVFYQSPCEAERHFLLPESVNWNTAECTYYTYRKSILNAYLNNIKRLLCAHFFFYISPLKYQVILIVCKMCNIHFTFQC